ncbi:hypothetical protein RND71_011094 [Anisodus tanguticus]|uniref:Uncharacterized protein n=1 Tax=Anisodus tanguticus TaxID=243964 RepID=A0AAE1VSP7_9SOLA|nr:hypothetical protein RND71_011094 [Anisodus tanguticus]
MCVSVVYMQTWKPLIVKIKLLLGIFHSQPNKPPAFSPSSSGSASISRKLIIRYLFTNEPYDCLL